MTDTATRNADSYSTHELRFERLLPAPVETVWAYLTDPDLRKMWFMGGATGSKVGDDVEMVMDHRNLSDGDVPTPEKYAPYIGNRWAETITRIEPPHVLAYSWDEGEGGTVTFELSAEGDDTRLVLTHTGLSGRDDAVNFGGGWHSHLAVLAKRLAGEGVANFWDLHAEAEAKAKAALD